MIATTSFGLEAVVARELQQLGCETQMPRPGWVTFAGNAWLLCRANLWLRSADRVLVQVADFDCADFDTLFDVTRELPWENWIGQNAAILVSVRSHASQLTSIPACQRTLKKALVERLVRCFGVDPWPETGPPCTVRLILSDNRAVLALDASGPGLQHRGYRTDDRPAHVKETLAAGLVQLSFWRADRPLIDPFCGSGTILIEAAWIAAQRAPGLMRRFAAEDWPGIDSSLWSAARSEAAAQVVELPATKLVGYDTSYHALVDARANAERAGVSDLIHFQQLPYRDVRSSRDFGCVITRIPESITLPQRTATETSQPAGGRPRRPTAPPPPLRETHDEIVRQVPEVLRKLPTWSHFLFSTHPQFEATVQKSADRRRKLYNGKIGGTYYQYHGPPPDDRPRSTLVPVFGGLSAKAHEQATLFANRLTKLARHLRRWPKQGITCFRLYERDIPEIPLVVDRYEDHLHMVEFERPHDRDLAEHAAWLDLMMQTAAKTLDIPLAQVFLKRRLRQRGNLQHERVDARRYEIEVAEGGLRFIVNLSDYADTGLFLDHRQTRAMVRQAAHGKSVLNLFCYTGAFTVYAAAGGAARTVSVDKSSHYVNWCRRNLLLNGMNQPEHALVTADIWEYLERLPSIPQFDLAVVDPPTFSNSKDQTDDWIVQRDHVRLLEAVRAVMKPQGIIFFSTNFRTFRWELPPSDEWTVREISKQTVPPDYRNQRIHRCWKLTRQAYTENRDRSEV